jgi:NAD(P)-dependent dehydrogenase (short-subunit alcohol dehydrogenase family)
LLARLTAIVSARTGYPEDMLGPDLDVEADLSIDSIKRLEILGELADAIGLTDGGSLDQLEDLVEELASRKTLRGVVDFLFEHGDRLDGAPSASAAPAPIAAPVETPSPPAAAPAAAPVTPAAPGAVGGATSGVADIPPAANRFVVSLADVPLAPPVATTDLVVQVSGTGPVAAALLDELAARGVDAIAPGRVATAAPTLVLFADLLAGPGEDAVTTPELYARLRPVLLDTGADVVVATPFGGGLGIDPPAPRPAGGDPFDVVPAGAGARGLVKTAALEFPERRVRVVDVDPGADVAETARVLADELTQADAPVEVAWRDGVRRTPRAERRAGAGEPGPSPLTADSVVLLTGGARGITAQVAVALVQSSGCHLELVGRTGLPAGAEDPMFAGAGDRAGLRHALVGAGWREPKAIEKECDRLLAEREMRATMAAVSGAGASLRYHQVDVCDAEALEAVVRSVYERHGRLDGIVHGAGVLDDHVIADKAPEAFARVFSTKVDAARTLLGAVRRATGDGDWGPPAFVTFFGSIAGVCGNRGQVDYAAANDALDTIAAANRDVAARVVALDWGPWAPGAGMVDASLARLFEESGMGLIEVGDGTAAVLDEIAVPADGAVAQVVVVRCSFDLMAASLSHGRLQAAGAHA